MRAFICDYKDVSLIALKLDCSGLPKFVNAWKTELFKKMKDKKAGKVQIDVKQFVKKVRARANILDIIYRNNTDMPRSENETICDAAEKILRDNKRNLGDCLKIAELSGSFFTQDEEIQTEAREEFENASVAKDSISFEDCAEKWWEGQKPDKLYDGLCALKDSEDIKKFLLENWGVLIQSLTSKSLGELLTPFPEVL